jgi:hypothetical protein
MKVLGAKVCDVQTRASALSMFAGMSLMSGTVPATSYRQMVEGCLVFRIFNITLPSCASSESGSRIGCVKYTFLVKPSVDGANEYGLASNTVLRWPFLCSLLSWRCSSSLFQVRANLNRHAWQKEQADRQGRAHWSYVERFNTAKLLSSRQVMVALRVEPGGPINARSPK